MIGKCGEWAKDKTIYNKWKETHFKHPIKWKYKSKAMHIIPKVACIY